MVIRERDTKNDDESPVDNFEDRWADYTLSRGGVPDRETGFKSTARRFWDMRDDEIREIGERVAGLEAALGRIYDLAQHAPVARQGEKTLAAIGAECRKALDRAPEAPRPSATRQR